MYIYLCEYVQYCYTDESDNSTQWRRKEGKKGSYLLGRYAKISAGVDPIR